VRGKPGNIKYVNGNIIPSLTAGPDESFDGVLNKADDARHTD
jgi:hypothetical protein